MQTGFDRRRINGPEESNPPAFEDEEAPIWNIGMPRRNRASFDIRPIFLQPGLINQATGSAYIETQNTKIACAVFGPRQAKNVIFNEKGRLNVDVKFAPFSCNRRRAPMRDAEDRSIAMAIHQAINPSIRLEVLPKSIIDVFITIVESDGIEGCVAAGAIAASTALTDAGIELFGLVVSCSAAAVGEDIWLDPSLKETQESRGTIVLSCMPALSTVTSIWQTGYMNINDVLSCMDACNSRCTDIHSVIAQVLLEST